MNGLANLRSTTSVVRAVMPLLLAVITSGILLAVIGKNPFAFFGAVIQFGLLGSGWQGSVILLAPLVLVAVGLTLAFRAGFWNLGVDGQFIIAAVLVAGVAPALTHTLPASIALIVLALIAIVSAALWSFIPAWLRATRQTNEIVTTLAMSFIALGIANLLVRGPFSDPAVLVPQTRVIPAEALLAFIPGTRVHVGVIFALVIALVAHFVLTRTSAGTRIDVLGSHPRTAQAVGMRVRLATIVIFAASAGMVGLAGFTDMMGVWGYARTDWNPAYGLAVIPFVLMARMNILAALPLLAFYAVFATGTTLAAQREGVSIDLTVIMVASVLGFLALTEWWFTRRERQVTRRAIAHPTLEVRP